MEETNPQGSQTDVNGAAAKIFGMLDPQPEGQAEVEAAPEESIGAEAVTLVTGVPI